VWLEYIWQSKSKTKRQATSSKKVIDKLNGDDNYEIILSPFLIREISSHYKDWFILQKVVKDGFSFGEFRQIKNKYSITDKEKEEINSIILRIGGIKNVNTLTTTDLNVTEIDRILWLEGEYNFEIYDALHFNTAINKKCSYLVTKDGKLRQSADMHNKQNTEKINCIKPVSFLRLL